MVMAIIYTKCKQYDKALDELEVLLSEQTSYSTKLLSRNSLFAPLRNLPRYQEMMKKYASATGSY